MVDAEENCFVNLFLEYNFCVIEVMVIILWTMRIFGSCGKWVCCVGFALMEVTLSGDKMKGIFSSPLFRMQQVEFLNCETEPGESYNFETHL